MSIWKANGAHIEEIRRAIETRDMSHLRPEQADALRRIALAADHELPEWCRPECVVYSPFHKANVPVVAANWSRGFWCLSTPGVHDDVANYSASRSSAPETNGAMRTVASSLPKWASKKLAGTMPATVARANRQTASGVSPAA